MRTTEYVPAHRGKDRAPTAEDIQFATSSYLADTERVSYSLQLVAAAVATEGSADNDVLHSGASRRGYSVATFALKDSTCSDVRYMIENHSPAVVTHTPPPKADREVILPTGHAEPD